MTFAPHAYVELRPLYSNSCPFCDPNERVLANELAYVRYDKFPVSPGHALIIPYRHVSDYFDLTEAEFEAIHALVRDIKGLIADKFEPDGFNVGINAGEAAGQTVWHVHVHLIPRYKGDVKNPRGGVRGVIPSKRSY